jgi:hypothetical protein
MALTLSYSETSSQPSVPYAECGDWVVSITHDESCQACQVPNPHRQISTCICYQVYLQKAMIASRTTIDIDFDQVDIVPKCI